ncbi:hypothetical protein TNCV_4713131 [Trichonephila clavipes]|nr:hypothetical protein TNCV_4713131 [Trichonephila clavipes]
MCRGADADKAIGIGETVGVRSCICIGVALCQFSRFQSLLLGEIRFAHESNTDEAHFWLNGYVNKQNCRIWSEANTQVYVETPLHPEKLTVWCPLWAGGILLQKR